MKSENRISRLALRGAAPSKRLNRATTQTRMMTQSIKFRLIFKAVPHSFLEAGKRCERGLGSKKSRHSPGKLNSALKLRRKQNVCAFNELHDRHIPANGDKSATER